MSEDDNTSPKEPMNAHFMDELFDYLDLADTITGQIAYAEDVADRNLDDEDAAKNYQDVLEETHDDLLHSLENYTLDLNYFMLIGQWDRKRLLRANKANIDQHHTGVAILEGDDEGIKAEINDITEEVFKALKELRAKMTPETQQEMLGLTSTNKYIEAYLQPAASQDGAPAQARFIEKEDMPDMMAIAFWQRYEQILDAYPISEAVQSDLQAFWDDPEYRQDRLKDILEGYQAAFFPARFCKLDDFSEEEIANMRNVIAMEKEEEKAYLKEQAENNSEGETTITDPSGADAPDNKVKTKADSDPTVIDATAQFEQASMPPPYRVIEGGALSGGQDKETQEENNRPVAKVV